MTGPSVGPAPHLLAVENLQIRFYTQRGMVEAVRGVSFHVDRGETVGLVGESGSGKSVIAQAVMDLIRIPGRVAGGEVYWKGRPLLIGADGDYVRQVRGKEIAMVFQDSMTSLDPVFSIGMQITEVLRHHLGLGAAQARERAAELLDLVGISAPRQRLKQYPHELSGGMRQRVMIAMALACEPALLIADEPTTALDVTIQAQILELIADIQQRLQLAILFITHDLGIAAGLCHRIAVMYAGKLVESGNTVDLFARPAHPYTAGLLRSTPRIDEVRERLVSIDGAPPDMRSPPAGCAFHPRCEFVVAVCTRDVPPFGVVAPDRRAACWRPFASSDAAGRSLEPSHG
jgi:peptide/nickel transport system ATP-binding protein